MSQAKGKGTVNGLIVVVVWGLYQPPDPEPPEPVSSRETMKTKKYYYKLWVKGGAIFFYEPHLTPSTPRGNFYPVSRGMVVLVLSHCKMTSAFEEQRSSGNPGQSDSSGNLYLIQLI